MVELDGTPSELKMTIQITRAATGEVETWEISGHPSTVQPEPMGETPEKE